MSSQRTSRSLMGLGARRRGTSIAAAALTVALVAPFASPIAAPQYAATAAAQETDPNAGFTSTALDADGIASGVVTNMNRLGDFVWVNKQRGEDKGGMVGGRLYAPSTPLLYTSVNTTPGLNGLVVHAQWMDEDGSVSPVYKATTKNLDGAAGGDGSYVFHFPNWTDANGVEHEFYAKPFKTRVKLWLAPGQVNPKTGLPLATLRSAPGATVGLNNESDGGAGMWSNIPQSFQYTGVFTYEYPNQDKGTESYLHLPEAKRREAEAPSQASTWDYPGSISGRVWWETGAMDAGVLHFPNSARENMFGAREGRVVTSVLAPEGVRAFEAFRTLSRQEKAVKQKEVLAAHPEYIMETVVAYTDDEGWYFADFKNKDWDWRYVYQHLETKDPITGEWKIQNTYSSFLDAMYGKPDAQFNVPQLWQAARHSWTNMHFAAVAEEPMAVELDKEIAYAGDPVVPSIQAIIPDGAKAKLVWKDSKGNVLKETPVAPGGYNSAKPFPEGTLTVGQISEDDTYRAELVVDGYITAADSLIVSVNGPDSMAAKYAPKYETTYIYDNGLGGAGGALGSDQRGIASIANAANALVPGAEGDAALPWDPNDSSQSVKFEVVGTLDPMLLGRGESNDDPNDGGWCYGNEGGNCLLNTLSPNPRVGRSDLAKEQAANGGEPLAEDSVEYASSIVLGVKEKAAALTDKAVPGSEAWVPVKVTYPDNSYEIIRAHFMYMDPENPPLNGTHDVLYSIGEAVIPGTEGGPVPAVSKPTIQKIDGEEVVEIDPAAGPTPVQGYALDTNSDQWPVDVAGNKIPADAVSVDSEGNVTWNVPADFTQGNYTFPVTVTYTDGSTDNTYAQFKVTVKETEVDNYPAPEYTETKVKQGDTAKVEAPIFTPGEGETAPAGGTYTFAAVPSSYDEEGNSVYRYPWATVNADGTIGLAPSAVENDPNFVEPGDYVIPVMVTFKDGSIQQAYAPVTVEKKSTIADGIDPKYDPTEVKVGSAGDSNDPFEKVDPAIDSVAPEAVADSGWTFAPGTEDPKLGKVNGKAPSLEQVAAAVGDAKYADIVANGEVAEDFKKIFAPSTMVTVTYGDDSTDEAQAPFVLLGVDNKPITNPEGDFDNDGATNDKDADPFDPNVNDAATYDPTYKEGKGNKGEEITVEAPSFGNKTKPEGTTFGLSEEALPADKELLPAGVTPNIDPATGKITVTVDEAGTYTIPVLVTYPDGSKETVFADVKVVNDYEPSYPGNYTTKTEPVVTGTVAKAGATTEALVKYGTDVPGEGVAKYAIKDWTAPDGYTVTVNTDGTVSVKVAPMGENGATQEILEVPVTVTYTDGAFEDVAKAIFLLDTDGDGTPDVDDEDDDNDGIKDGEDKFPKVPSTASQLTPSYPADTTVAQGGQESIAAPTFDTKSTSDVEKAAAPEGTTFAPGADAPAWAEVNKETGAITVKPGLDVEAKDYTVPVVITYKDGSTASVNAPVKVTPAPVTPVADYPGTGTVEQGDQIEITPTTPAQDGTTPKLVDPETGEPTDSYTKDGITVTIDPQGKITVKADDDAKIGDHTVDVVLTDEDGKVIPESTDTIVITVVDGPAVNGGEDQHVVEGNSITPIKPEITGAPEGSTVVVTAPEGLTYNKETGEITGTPVVEDWKDGEDFRELEVKIEIKDKENTVAEDTVKVIVHRDTDGDGTPDEGYTDGDKVVPGDTDDDNDGISDEQEEKDGTDSRDGNSANYSLGKIEDKVLTKDQPIAEIPVVVSPAIPASTPENPVDTKVVVDGLPAGLAFKDGKIAGTPTTNGTSTVTVKVVGKNGQPVKDAAGKDVTTTFQITVQDAPANPTADYPGTGTVEQGGKIDITPSTPAVDGTTPKLVDPETGNPVDEYTKDGITVTIDPQGKITIEAAEDATPGKRDVDVVLTDEDGKVIPESQDTIVIDVVDGPTVNGGEDQNVIEGNEIKPIKPEIVGVPEGGKVEVTLPEGLTLNEDNNTITGTPVITDWADDEDFRELEVKIEIKDKDNNTVAEDTVKVIVHRDTDGDGTPDEGYTDLDGTVIPGDADDDNDGISDEQEEKDGTDSRNGNSAQYAIGDIADVVTDKGTPIKDIPIVVTPAIPAGTEANPVDTTLVVDGLPEGLTFTDGKITGTPTENGEYKVTAKVVDKDGTTIKDAAGNGVAKTFTITVKDATVAPEWGDGKGKQGEDVKVPLEKGDFDPSHTVETSDKDVTAEFDKDGNVIIKIGDNAKPGDVTITVKDGDTTVDEFSITVTEKDKVVPPAPESSSEAAKRCFVNSDFAIWNPIYWLIPAGILTAVPLPDSVQAQLDGIAGQLNNTVNQMAGNLGIANLLPRVEVPAALNINTYMTPDQQRQLIGAAMVVAGLAATGFYLNWCINSDDEGEFTSSEWSRPSKA